MPKKTQKNRLIKKLARAVSLNGYTVELWRTGESFEVVYEKEIKSDLDYSNAARAFGLAVLHACARGHLLDGMPPEPDEEEGE